MDLITKAGELLAGCDTVSLASVNENGYPRVCIINRVDSKGIGEIWFSTGTNSAKTRHFAANPKASVCFHRDGDSVTLLGKVEMLRDRETLAAMWREDFIEHFPGGVDDPNYCVLRFRGEEATLWIGRVFETVKL